MSLRDASNRVAVLVLLGAAVLPLTCFAPLLPAPAGRILLVAYACAAVRGVAVLVRRMHREGRRLTAYDDEIHHVCPACGYDLRATPGRCPECGRQAGAGLED